MAKHDNPAFTFFANDVLAWEPISFLTDAQLGQAFKLIVYGAKNGGSLPIDHLLFSVIDAKVIELCTRLDGGRRAVVRPIDLPKLMLSREDYLKGLRSAGSKGGRNSAIARKKKFGTAKPGGHHEA